jgi:hypothetical protein
MQVIFWPLIICIDIFTICWYTPAEQPPPKLAEANNILDDESIKWSSKPTGPIKQRLKKMTCC